MSSKWSRGDAIGCASLIVAIVAVVIATVTPEIRCFLRLKSEACSFLADTSKESSDEASKESMEDQEVEPPDAPSPASSASDLDIPPPPGSATSDESEGFNVPSFSRSSSNGESNNNSVPEPGSPPPLVAPVSKDLPTAGYPARVTQPIGLILRDQPSRNAERVGGINFNQRLTVLENSLDGEWQRVRMSNGTEGWVRGGNTERVN